MSHTRLAAKLLKWYAANSRDLPWRRRVSPYRTWVSEVMLQQTRVDVVIPYFRRWMRRFPSMRKLAASNERDVLSLWEGLGYYSRARNLRRAAQSVVREHRGRLPSDPTALKKLPGVGEYIAAAIASIAFGGDFPALDGNVLRVLARVSCTRTSPNSPAGRARLKEVAWTHVPRGRAGEFNQALMDLGASICVPRRPRCGICPIEGVCEARIRGQELRVPRPVPTRRRPHYVDRAAVILRGRDVLLVRRTHASLLGGLWEFPKAGRRSHLPTNRQMLQGLNLGAPQSVHSKSPTGTPLGTIDHTYSHFSITVHAFVLRQTSARGMRGQLWVPVKRLPDYPMGKVDREIANRLQQRMGELDSESASSVLTAR
ncbi:MAG TPA: A/G-specific adenine glycosylase [Anaerolineales bacterium]|nr:A/G-specific adenine glycosylase [Anaerolineales bacterium]